MKTKKLVSLFLAVAMIFAVFTISVSAAEDIDWADSGQETGINTNLQYCTGVAFLQFTNYNRFLKASTQVINTHDTLTQKFRVQVQCAINYASGEYDFDSNLIVATVPPRTGSVGGSASANLTMYADSNETITSFVAEYHIGDEQGNPLWNAYYPRTYTLGINA